MVTGELRFLDRVDGLVAAGLTILGAALLLWNLGAHSLHDWDEATYAEIAREAAYFHDWIHLHWNYAPWLNKPPLYIWLTSLTFNFGVSEFTARLVAALSGALTLGATYLIARFYGTRLMAALAALVLAGCHEFLAGSRLGQSDATLTLLLYATLLAFLLALRNPRWWYVAGVALGLAIMTKGAAAFVAPAAVLVALALDRRLSVLRRVQPWTALAIALLIAAPWHLAVYAWQGPAFTQQYFGYMLATRATQEIEGHSGGLLYYAVQARNQFYPWAYLAPFAFAWHLFSARLRVARHSDVASTPLASSVLAVFAVVVLLLYTAVRSKLVWYVLPIYPALAIMVAQLIVDGWRGATFPRIAVGVAVVLAVLWVPHSVTPTPVLLVATVLAVAVVIRVAMTVGRARFDLPLPALATVLFVLMSGVAAAGLYDLERSPVVPIALAAGTGRPDPRCCLYLDITSAQRYSDDDVSHSLLFYSRRSVAPVTGGNGLASAVSCAGDAVFRTANADAIRHYFNVDVQLVAPPWTYGRVTSKTCK